MTHNILCIEMSYGLWTMAGQWSAGQMKDGQVPAYMIEELGGNKRLAAVLVAAGLWEEVDGGYQFHDWSDWQKTREQVENERSKARERMAKLRNSSRDVRPNKRRTSGDVRDPLPYPTQPQVLSELEEPLPPLRDDVERLCCLLAEKIESNGSKRPTITKAWRDAARLMIDNDRRTEEQISKCINWCQADPFWKTNILSMPKLREKFDQMRLKAAEANGTARPKTDALGFLIS